MDKQTFERLVAEALNDLPAFFRAKLDNIEVVVEDWPDPATMQQAGASHPAGLMGFYHGVPRTARTQGYTLVMPDKISIYQRPIEMACRSPAEIRAMAAHVVEHEIAHHFGIDDDRLREIGAY